MGKWSFLVAIVVVDVVTAFVPIATLQRRCDPLRTKEISSVEAIEIVDTPNPDLSAVAVTRNCMESLKTLPSHQSLEVCFNFSTDRCRAAVGGSLEEFIQYAANPVFSALVNCDSYEFVSIGPIIASGMHRGAMQTVLVDVKKGFTVGDAMRAGQEKEKAKSPRRRLLAKKEKEEADDAEETKPKDDGKKRFLWTLQQERRPPRQNCWLVHEVLFTKNAFELTL
jgi:hypothetical protein